jgi:3-mercaptopyruvate sulfurtransferase SseA
MRKGIKTLPIFPILMIAAGILLFTGAVFWTANQPSNTIRISPTAPVANIPYPNVSRISVEEAKSAFDEGSAIFIDTRGDSNYAQGHIPGALSITESELLSQIGEFNTSDWIITYCT